MELLKFKRSKKLRIAVVGFPRTGKRSLILSYIKRCPTINVSPNQDNRRKFYLKTNFLRRNVKLKLVNAKSDHETYSKCCKSDTVIACYSVSDRKSFENLKKHAKSIITGVPILLVGTKIDERQNGVSITDLVHHNEGIDLKRDLGAVGFVECSSKTFANINKVFEQAIKSAHSNKAVQFSIQLTIVGDRGIGKSFLINKMITHYQLSQHSIIGNSSVYSIIMPNRKVYIVTFLEVTRNDLNDPAFWYRQSFMTDAFLLMYSTQFRETFINVKTKWLPKIKEMCSETPVILISYENPLFINLKNKDMVTTAEGQNLQKEIRADAFIEYTSEFEVNKIVEISAYAIEHNSNFKGRLCVLQ